MNIGKFIVENWEISIPIAITVTLISFTIIIKIKSIKNVLKIYLPNIKDSFNHVSICKDNVLFKFEKNINYYPNKTPQKEQENKESAHPKREQTSLSEHIHKNVKPLTEYMKYNEEVRELKILDVIRDNPFLTKWQLFDAAQMTEHAFNRCIYNLKKEGKIVVTGSRDIPLFSIKENSPITLTDIEITEK